MITGFGKGLLSVIARLLNVIDDIVEPRFILALLAMLGFFWIAYQVIDRLTNPPASELFTVLNLALTPVAAAVAYWFGYDQGKGSQPPST